MLTGNLLYVNLPCPGEYTLKRRRGGMVSVAKVEEEESDELHFTTSTS